MTSRLASVCKGKGGKMGGEGNGNEQKEKRRRISCDDTDGADVQPIPTPTNHYIAVLPA
jgi:hypothetical protein